MRKLIALGAVVLALAAAAMPVPVGQGDSQDHAFPGERIEVRGAAASFGGTLQEPQ